MSLTISFIFFVIERGTCGWRADKKAFYGGNFCSFLTCSARGRPLGKEGRVFIRVSEYRDMLESWCVVW